MLVNEAALKQRIYSVYRAMATKARPRFWKTGRYAGRLRVPGLDKLPFTKEQLWHHALNQVGEGRVACPYCVESGRNLLFISLEDFVFDHHVPLSRGGTWQLSNLQACCRRCNTEKGEFSYEFFLRLVSTIHGWPDLADKEAAYKCLRSQGLAHQFRRDFKKSKALPADVVADVMKLEF